MKLIDLLEKYNFRYITPNCSSENKKLNTDIIRIKYGEMLEDWFEFGIEDYSANTMKRMKRIINKEFLNAEVLDFGLDQELNTVIINVDVR